MSEKTTNQQQIEKYRDLFIEITGKSTVTERQEEARLRRTDDSEKYHEHQALSEYVKTSANADGLGDAVGGADSTSES
ncbi:hypothetical protein E6P09_14725 [Haloferax mediterranei ATCC 33500]|uniref:Uncharacterized protein n=1 Tax=Haloferax mediterranei (strain ATCC 33500 / DSM 1411 / JCM 8866 / NBRC 14739 / NCIMB 2177 / R-4) TaxID=523841 RepID=I3R789_HALMT|nr:hypothetical protein [Haloferax mediterranei]AFK20099.1 hypothetical protein HFX_2414 [Haloferax mediterranei ATCC 33500]AHZ23473.1 hypothetical protein BM92_12850 [Haloferax mediterranei ATCC 33500]ELZ99645.1 hypothetical protein C439_13864 [Haloferax mediterranei ATCC 33500]MDX5987151.1 hypothetical protein [Haloferax mediterranei ATCC 33500]QCQ76462.1 hypothetical protein E6P09_14725 [Haloferax mediterranei ATCC 33500]